MSGIILSCVTCVGCCIFLFVVVGIPVIVYEEVLKYQNPTFNLDHASITGFNLTSDGFFSSFFNVLIKANNPNHKVTLKYSDVRVSIFKDKQNLAEDALENFSQRKRNMTLLKADPIALSVVLKKAPLFDFGLESGRGYLDFDVFITATLNGYSVLKVNCQHAIVNVTVRPFVASSPSSGSVNNTQNFKSIDCSVSTFTGFG